MNLRIIIAIILFVFINNIVFSQTPPYKHYTSDDGLPSSTVYDIIQDKEGYIWIATENGLSRFDGTRFKNYGINDGLNSTFIRSLVEGDSGEIYIGNYNKGINLYKNGKITSFTSPGSNQERIGDIFLKNNRLYAYTSDFLITYNNGFSENFSSFDFGYLPDGSVLPTHNIKITSDGAFLVLTGNGIYKLEDKTFRKLNIEGLLNSEVYDVFEDGKGNLYAGSNGSLYVIRNNKVIKSIKTDKLDDKIFKVIVDSKGNIWFSVLNKGFRVIYKDSDRIVDISNKLNMQKAVVNKILEDNEGNIWVSTVGKGILCLNNLYLNNYSEEDGLSNNEVHAFAKDNNGRIIIGTYNGINFLENGRFNVYKFSNELTNYVFELNFHNNQVFLCTSGNFIKVQESFFNNLRFTIFNSASFCIAKDSTYYLGAWSNSYYRNKNLSIIYNKYDAVLGDSFINNRTNEILEDSKGNIWFGTDLGVCKMTNNEKTYFPDNLVLNSSISSIKEDIRGKIWFAGEKGVAIYNLNSSKITNITNIDNYDFSASSSIEFDKNNRVWIGNAKGLFILDNNSVKYFNKKTGLPSDEVSSLFYDKETNKMYIGTNNGFSTFDIDYYDNYKPQSLNIKIEYIKSGDSVYTKFNNLEFEPEDNNIYISFSAINYSSPSTLTYQYKIGDKWINNENKFLDFSSMEEGKYNVSLRAKSQNSEWCEPAYISFKVKPIFTETFLFKLLMFLLASGVILIFALYRINLNKKKNAGKIEITKRMNELKHQALSSMMNPHFIFNSLNSVQYLVNKDRKTEANNYIAMMGKLIRINLDIAGNSFILLKEERDRLALYLDIEMLRFEDKFSYEINFGKDIDINSIMIPNMIIQPFVENAVWHGIMNSGKKGFVKVSFGFENISADSEVYKCLLIKITDNGIGYKKSKENKKEGHISKGIKIIEERLKILSHDLNLPKPVIVEDLSDRAETATGTEVIISLPPSIYKHKETKE